jgi:competence protein ComEA
MGMNKSTTKPWWLIAIGIVGGLFGAAIMILFTSQPRGEAVVLLPPPTPKPILVHVTGAVTNPDLYSLPPGSNVQDAIETAGGLLPEAYTDTLNLATKLEDGDKLLLPFQPQPDSNLPQENNHTSSTAETKFPININTATLDELDILPGIGEVKAQAIIEYRQSNGAFVAIEQIQNVSGIGPATFEKIENLITVNENP